MNNKFSNIGRRGAHSGLILGGLLVIIFAINFYIAERASSGASAGALLPFIALVLMICVPVVCYKRLRRSYTASGGTLIMSAMWLEGIIAFFCGSLITAALTFIYMRWVNPAFVTNFITGVSQTLIDTGDAEMAHTGETLIKMMEQHLVPRPIEFCMSFIWVITFLGSMLSLIMAAVIRWCQR